MNYYFILFVSFFFSLILKYDIEYWLFESCFNIAQMDDNLVSSETHKLAPINYFDLNGLPQEGTIIFYFICNPYFI